MKGNSATNEARKEIKTLFEGLATAGYIEKSTVKSYQNSFWIAFEQGVHSEDMTSIDLKRGIDPLYLELIDDEIERDTTTPREILRLIKAKDWNDSVDFPTEIQISNRKSHIAHNKEGPLTQYKYAVNIKNWVTENILKSKEQYQALHPHQWFTIMKNLLLKRRALPLHTLLNKGE
jgi:hypothetical protein